MTWATRSSDVGVALATRASSDAPLAEVELGVPFEAEANRFARCLLVPKPWVEFLVGRGWKPADLARRFEVSERVFWNAFTAYGLV